MSGLKAKAGLLFFVSAGIFAGLVVFGNTVAPKKIRAVPAYTADGGAAQAIDSFQDAIGDEAPLPSEAAQGATPMPVHTADGGNNLTRSLASLIGKSIVDKNPEGPAGDDLAVTGADGMADAAAEESLRRFNPAYFSPDVLRSELTIDAGQDAGSYRASAAKLVTEAEAQPMPPAGTPVAEKMKLLAKRYESEAIGLRALAVPPDLVTEHMKAIRIAEGRRRILEAVADYENDPIYAMLALRLWDTLK